MSDAPEPIATQAIRAPLVGMAVNASLAAIKILAGTFGNSYALIADGIESTSDVVTSRSSRARWTPRKAAAN